MYQMPNKPIQEWTQEELQAYEIAMRQQREHAAWKARKEFHREDDERHLAYLRSIHGR